MAFKLIGHVESFGDAGFIAWIDSIKGMVVQAKTKEDAWKELMISLRVKLAFDLGIHMDNINEKQVFSEQELEETFKKLEGNGEKEINLTLA